MSAATGPAPRDRADSIDTASMTAPATTATDAPADYCPRCVQHDPTAPPTATARPDDWHCRSCGLRAADAEDAAAYVGAVVPGEILERLYARRWRGEEVDPDRFAIAVGRYHSGDAPGLLAEVLHDVRAGGTLAAGTDGDMARRTLAAVVAAGFAVVAA